MILSRNSSFPDIAPIRSRAPTDLIYHFALQMPRAPSTTYNLSLSPSLFLSRARAEIRQPPSARTREISISIETSGSIGFRRVSVRRARLQSSFLIFLVDVSLRF